MKKEIEEILSEFRNNNDYPDTNIEPNKWHIENECNTRAKILSLIEKEIEGCKDIIKRSLQTMVYFAAERGIDWAYEQADKQIKTIMFDIKSKLKG